MPVLAGVLGYFMGQAHFEKTPAYYMPLGGALAAVLNGLYFFLLDRTGVGHLAHPPGAIFSGRIPGT